MNEINIWVDARKINKIMLNEKNFTRWIKRKIEQNRLVINQDYFIKKENIQTLKQITQVKNIYFLSIEACKKIILSQSKSVIAKKIRKEMQEGRRLSDILTELYQEDETKIIKISDEEYPEQLKKIKNPPKQLYVKGNIENLKEYGIAVVGTRDCTIYGRRICKIFTNNLVGYNLNIISGMAKGIDCCAHKACIEAKGKTIAVLPSGFNNIFPKENDELMEKILKNGGTVITEYPPEFEKTSESCRERNRIVSGLAIATLVIEAEERSGTRITVRNTNEQNKKAFCVPSSLLNSKGIGTNQLLKEKKAQIATNAEDIINELPEYKLERKKDFKFMKAITNEKTKEKISKENIKIDEENKEIYDVLTKEEKTIDEITEELNRPINEITYKLTLLELQGAIEELPGKKFRIKKG